MNQKLIKHNQEMEDMLSRVPDEKVKKIFLTEFKVFWERKLIEIKQLEAERNEMKDHTKSIYVVLFFSMIFAFFDLISGYPIVNYHQIFIYPSTIGWVLIFIAGLQLISSKKSFEKLTVSLKLNSSFKEIIF